MQDQQRTRDRRAEIAAAGIRIIATQGVRALTHRAIDAELGLASGSTSYYARTRRDLVALIVQRLAARTSAEMAGVPLPERLTAPQAAAILARGIDVLAHRSDEHLARFALHIEYRHEPGMLAALAGDPPLQPQLIAAAEELLRALGVEEPAQHAPDLVALTDSLLMHRVVRGAPLDAEAVTRAYLTGLVAPQVS